MASGDESSKLGQRSAIVLAATGVFWIAAEFVGAQAGWTNRTLGLINLIALAGFGVGLWIAFQAWQARRNDE